MDVCIALVGRRRLVNAAVRTLLSPVAADCRLMWSAAATFRVDQLAQHLETFVQHRQYRDADARTQHFCTQTMRYFITPPPPIGERNVAMSVSVSLCVCLSAIISSELHVRSSSNCLCMLHTSVAVALSSSGGVVIRYVLPVLWMTSYLLISKGCSTSPPS